MKNSEIYIVGAGGFARETLTIYEDLGLWDDVKGFVEENSLKTGSLLNGKNVLDFSSFANASNANRYKVIVAIGSNKRDRIVNKLENQDYTFDTLIHPSVIFHKKVKIGYDCIIAPSVILTTNIELGNHIILNLACSIGHDVAISDFTTISPGARVSGSVRIGKQVFIGNNASINEGVKIGNGAVIGAGAVVTEDVPDLALVVGVPGKIKKIYDSMEDRPW